MDKLPSATGACMICYRPITPQFWACAECEKEYGLTGPLRDWPAWARQLKADHEAERRQEAEMAIYLVDAPDEYDRICYGEDDGMRDCMDDNGEPIDDYAGAWERLREMGINTDD